MANILFILSSLGTDGISNNTMNYYKFYKNPAIHIDYVVGKLIRPKKEWLEMLKKRNSCIFEIPNRNKNPFKYVKELRKILKNGNYNIVHAMGSSSLLLLEMYAAYKEHVKVRIAHSRNTDCDHHVLNKILKPLFIKYTTDRFSCGQEAGEWLFGNKDFLIINNGNDFDKFKYKNNKVVQFEHNKINIVSTGAINKQKNYLFMAKTIKRLVQKNKNICYYIIGNKEYNEFDKLKKYIECNHLENFIKIVGVVDNPQDYLFAGDIFAFPSIFEGFPNGLIEAQISGISCIVSNKITPDACLCDNVHRLGIDDKDIDFWVDKILNINTKYDREMKSNQNVTILRNAGYDIEENALFLENKYIELYNSNYLKTNIGDK